jgi:hypothetical protein
MTLIHEMSAAYLNGPEIVLSPEIKSAFSVWLGDQFRKLTMHVEIRYVDCEMPLALAMKLLEVSDILFVSSLGTDPVEGLMDANTNLRFRVVHDLMHHKLGADDSWQGELMVTLGHLQTAPDILWPIIASEVAGKAAVCITTGEFPEQRLSADCIKLLVAEEVNQ